MKLIWRALVLLVLALLLWPEFGRYRGEYALSAAAARVERVLRGMDVGAAAVDSAQAAHAETVRARHWLPGDARPAHIDATALMLLNQGAMAVQVLNSALATGERAELCLNLGRARYQSGDPEGAARAYLRTAWAAPSAIATLPSAMQADLVAEVARLDAELAAGRLNAPPALD